MEQPLVALGTVENNRYVVERLIGRGGMSSVYRATDRASGQPVAIKYLALRTQLRQEAARFQREIQLLSELSHPAIVGYVHHGLSAAGLPYLVMEWIEGEDLSHRLQRGPLTIAESIQLLRHICEPLHTLHSRGIVHRDLKPNNLFLRNGRLDGVTLLDLGIARRGANTRVMTQTGAVVGTPEYMSPEQARGHREITPASDIFSLGCVLHECLTGQPPFLGEQPAALLGRLLFGDAPRLSTAWRNVSPQLDALVLEMLLREPSQRPQNANALQDRLAQIPVPDERTAVQPLPPSALGVGNDEQKLVCVVLAAEAKSASETPVDGEAPIDPGAERPHEARRLPHLPQTVEWLPDGSLCATVSGMGTATDQVAAAARLALTLRAAWPAALVVLSTGRAHPVDRLPFGEAMNRAAELLQRQRDRLPSLRSGDPACAEQTRVVWLDPLSADLLGTPFQTAELLAGHALLGERDRLDDPRPVLGQPAPFVGRDQDRVFLDMALSGAIDQQAPFAVLVTGPAGVGKSRLCHEFLRRQGEKGQPLTLLFGRGDPHAVGSAYAPLGQALRRACGIKPCASVDERRNAIRSHLAQLHADALRAGPVPGDDAPVAAALLGELMGVPFPDEEDPALSLARSDPKVWADQVAQSFLQYLQLSARHTPVVLVLEDLHWTDSQSILLVDRALRELKQPLLVLGLARPEILTLYPQLWSGRVQPHRLANLGRRAAERWVRQVLGAQTDPTVVDLIVGRGNGNAFDLHELIRSATSGDSDTWPETLLATEQVRQHSLDASQRRVLRLASVFGESFSQAGILALQPIGLSGHELYATLRALCEAELVSAPRDNRRSDRGEYCFGSTLAREAAYRLLTDEDRSRAHSLAAEFLEQTEAANPLALAEHFRLGNQPERAVDLYIRAAEQALSDHQLQAVLDRVALARGCRASDEKQGMLSALSCAAHFWRDDFASSYAVGVEAMERLPRGSPRWIQTLGHMLALTGLRGQTDEFRRWLAEFSTVLPSDETAAAYVEAGSLLCCVLSLRGMRELVQSFLSLIASLGHSALASDRAALASYKHAQAAFLLLLADAPQQAVTLAREGHQAAQQAGARRHQVLVGSLLGSALTQAGDHTEAEAVLRESLRQAQQLSEPLALSHAKVWLAMALRDGTDRAAQNEAAELAGSVVARPRSNAFFVAASQCVLAHVRCQQGDLSGAEAACAAVASLQDVLPILHGLSLSTEVAVCLADQRMEAARVVVAQAQAVLDRLSPLGLAERPLRAAVALFAAH